MREIFTRYLKLKSQFISIWFSFWFRITYGSPSPDTPRTPAQHRIIPNDNSVLINALAMKYLPCEMNGTPPSPFLRNATLQMTTPTNVRTTTAAEVQTQMTPATPTTPASTSTTVNGFVMNRQNDLDGSKTPNTDMSITSYRYMEKYGLLWFSANFTWTIQVVFSIKFNLFPSFCWNSNTGKFFVSKCLMWTIKLPNIPRLPNCLLCAN